MGCYDLALADAVKSTEIKPDWAKGYFRKGAALQALGRHEEAFQSFYECLTLEDEKAAKQVHTETTWKFQIPKTLRSGRLKASFWGLLGLTLITKYIDGSRAVVVWILAKVLNWVNE